MAKKTDKRIVILFVILFLAGAIATAGYGQPLDEQFETGTMLSNMKEYALQLPEGKIRNKLLNLSVLRSIEPISVNEEKDHGEAAYYPYVILSFVLTKFVDINKMWILHLYTFVLFFSGVLALYYLCRKLFDSWKMGILAALMLYMTPRIFADGHYNNKDMVLLVFAIITITAGVYLIEHPKYQYAVLLGLAGAVAMNTKIAGAWFYGMMGFGYLFTLFFKKDWNRRTVLIGITAIVSFLFWYYLLTPAMWSGPIAYIRYCLSAANDFTRWDNDILYNGLLYKNSVNPLPKTYLLKMIGITTPVAILGLLACGCVSLCIRVFLTAMNRFRKDKSGKKAVLGKKDWYILFITFLWVFPLVYAVISGTRVYNGWRHFYFIYGAMVVSAAYGAEEVYRLLVRGADACRVKRCCYAVAAATAVFYAVGLVWNYPYHFAYYNILAGSAVEDRYELDYWNVAALHVLRQIVVPADMHRAVTVGSCDNWSAVGVRKNISVLEGDELLYLADWKEADYIMLNPTYTAIYPSEDADFVRTHYEKVYEAVSYGNVIMELYRKAS